MEALSPYKVQNMVKQWSKMVQIWSKMVQKLQKYHKMAKITKYGQNDQKWPKRGKKAKMQRWAKQD
jgi:hypothetical protein